ncbi:MAG: hypothetical protein R3Y56_11165, partial [Akkermansia sp.]
ISGTGSLESVDYDIRLDVDSSTMGDRAAIRISGTNASMGDLEEGTSITVLRNNTSSDGSTNKDYVYGITCASGSVGDINGDIYVSTTGSTGAYGINIAVSYGSLGVIRGTITASVESTNQNAFGIRFTSINEDMSVTFGAGAEVITIRGESVGTAVQNPRSLTLNVENYCANSESVTLYGSLVSTYGDIYFESGNYDITSSLWTAKSVIFTQNASVLLAGEPDSQSSAGCISTTATLVFELEHDVDGAILTLAEDSYFSAMESITVQLSDELYAKYSDLISAQAWDAIDFHIIDATSDISLACMEDTEFSITNADGSITYASGLSYSDCNFVISSGSGGDGSDTDFDVVPEPATSTLSLLALTALLARRRRMINA